METRNELKLKTSMYEWQEKAVEKLLPIRIGALYMEMGTGKTRVALEIIARRLQKGKIARVLWLCPCSVKKNLASDLSKHCEGWENIIEIQGLESLSGSEALYNRLYEFAVKFHPMLIVDESNLVKNFRAIRTQRIMAFSGNCPYRMILNGTPVSRNEADLFAQWYILDWRVLGYRSFWGFAANHLEFDEKFKHKIRRVLNVDYLTDKISPYTYTVKKADVMSLPPKRYREFTFCLEDEQIAHYKHVMNSFLDTLIDNDDETAIYRTFTALQHVSSGRKIISKADQPIKHVPFFDDERDNPRLDRLLDAVNWIGNDEKIIIWAKYKYEIESICKMLEETYGNDSVREFTGDVPLKKRQKAIDDFSKHARFLVANKACGGYGLNLQFCHNMIYYSNDWDWATRAQSEDRVYRLGQESTVMIIDICADFGIDKKIARCLERKEGMTQVFKGILTDKNKQTAKDWLEGASE